MIKTIVIGLLSVFVILMAVIAWQMARMVVVNWSKLKGWSRYPREDREHMALWVGLPLMKIGLLIFVCDALLALVQGVPMTERGAVRGLAALPWVLAASVVQLWLIFSVRYGEGRGDRRWVWTMLGSAAISVLILVVLTVAGRL